MSQGHTAVEQEGSRILVGLLGRRISNWILQATGFAMLRVDQSVISVEEKGRSSNGEDVAEDKRREHGDGWTGR